MNLVDSRVAGNDSLITGCSVSYTSCPLASYHVCNFDNGNLTSCLRFGKWKS
uniref:Uncharacterized protein n=1 Tax=Ciona intestinalis TaxID=7719 RepID=H2XZB6_CIOIN